MTELNEIKIVHIGLGKTASSTLQTRIFPEICDKLNLELVPVHNLIKRDHYLSNYTINYINLGDNNKFHSHYGQFNIFFVPPDYSVSECKNIIKYIKKINSSQLILCVEKNFGKIFSNWDDNIIFLPSKKIEQAESRVPPSR